MFKSKTNSTYSPALESSKADTAAVGNGRPASTVVTEDANGPIPLEAGVDVGKEAKEKKEKSSWVKSGIRTLRLRRSTDSRSSRLSLPGFSSLDRSGKSKKNKAGKSDDKEFSSSSIEPQYGIITDSKDVPNNLVVQNSSNSDQASGSGIISEQVKVSNNSNNDNPASYLNESSPSPNLGISGAVKDTGTIGAGENSDKHDPARFLGEGLTFKGKLIGVLEVNGPRGDRICQEALSDLKMAVKAAGEHKQKVTVHVALDGLRIRDEKTGDCLYHHQVHKISFIAQDLTDTRAFGYIFGSPDTGHRFFGIKTEKSASQVVIAMRDLFQVVFDFKKKEIEKAKQQLEMQQKFLATRAQETAPTSSKPEPKFAIAETYIEGACASGNSRPVPNRVAPEVDLLNLEVELTSLQEGLDSIHHNLSESVPFRGSGSTASISSDPADPMNHNMPKRSSVSSYNAKNTTPIPFTFGGGGISDPFGDSFGDPFSSETSGHHSSTNFHLGTSSKVGSALTCSFTSDPFAQVDPFPGYKYPGDTDFFNSDPFDSPSGPHSFSFPAPEAINSTSFHKNPDSDSRLQRVSSINGSPTPRPKIVDNHSTGLSLSGQQDVTKEKVGWTASFEDNFVPEADPMAVSLNKLSKPDRGDVFKDLDPLGVRRTNKSMIDRPTASSGFAESSSVAKTNTNTLQPSKMQQFDSANIPNSFSTNFSPSNATSELEFKTSLSAFNARAESPPNYSPPPPPRITGSPNPASQASNTHVPHILPPVTSSPRLSKKKSPQILKQITISDNTSSSPKALPKPTIQLGKQFTLDSSSFKDDIPNLSPPPRPPHGQAGGTGSGTLKSGPGSLTSAVPRPTSGSSDKGKKVPGNVSVIGLPPEPPPRPVQSSFSSASQQHPLQLVSPPPPLPPKKQSLSSTISAPLGLKQDAKKPVSTTMSRSSASNDLPLPLPLRKMHGVSSEQSNFSALHSSGGGGGRYEVPESNRSLTGSPHSQRSNTSEKSMSMEQALTHVASMSLRDLAVKLELPVDRLSSYTIQQLAQKLTEMKINKKTARPEIMSQSSQFSEKSDFGFDDDFSTASAPPRGQRESGFDRYAVFRDIAVEDASGFSIVNNVGSINMDRNNSEEDEELSTTTLEKQFTSRESSSERTLQADDITEPMKSASFAASAMANTMDDVTDVNFSDDQDNGKFGLDDDDDMAAGFVKNEWATFESNFDDQFATTALVKAEDGNESPWDSDEGGIKPNNSPSSINDKMTPHLTDHYDFKPFEKPPELQSVEDHRHPRKYTDGDGRVKSTSTPEAIRSPTGQFQRQSSGSSRQSERSSGNNPHAATGTGKVSDFSDSGKPERRMRHRRGSYKEYEHSEFDRDREGSGRYNRDRERERDREYRPDSRSSYTSIPRKYRNGDSADEECNSNSIRRIKSRGGPGTTSSSTYRRRSKDYDREREGEIDDEEDDRSYASHHSNYSTRRHRRYPSSKHYSHHGRPGRGGDRRAGSPDRYSNHESDDESMEDELYARKRDRENYAREREYFERHNRPRPNSGSSTGGKRYSPRHPQDSYYRRGRRRGGYKDDEDYGDSREFSEYSGEDDHPSSHGHHRRMRAKRSTYYRDRDAREPPPRGHYYTNSPSSRSDEGEKESDPKAVVGSKSRRPNSGKDRSGEDRHNSRRESPEQQYGRRTEKESSSRRYQSELALNNSKLQDSPKLSAINFDDDFGATSPHSENNVKSRNASLSSPLVQDNNIIVNDLMTEEIPQKQNDNLDANKKSHSPFEDDFVVDNSKSQNGEPVPEIDNLLVIDDPEEQHEIRNDTVTHEDLKNSGIETEASLAKNGNGIIEGKQDTFPPENESKVFSYSGRRLESIKSEEEKSNDDSHSHSHNSEGIVQMKKSDSFNIFKQRADDPFADDEFFT